MEFITKIKKYKVFLFIIGCVFAIVLGGKDTNYWGLKAKSGEQILKDIDKGAIEPWEIVLTENQQQEISNLIAKAPNNYSKAQKALISRKTGAEILSEYEKLSSHGIVLNNNQYHEIRNLIKANPKKYTEEQKLLVKDKSGAEILRVIGSGKRNPKSIELTPKQREEVKELLLLNPLRYTEAQKALIPEIKDELELIATKLKTQPLKPITLNLTGRQVLNAVGLGDYLPEEIQLTKKQHEEIKVLLLKSPNSYNKVQKKLIPELKTRLKQLSQEGGTEGNQEDISSMTAQEILKEVGWGAINPNEIKLSSSQIEEIKVLIETNPEAYNANQKALIK